jgi:type IV pilus assembly protein PilZ
VTSERREHPRTPVELQVAYEQLNAFFSDYTRNISKGGTFIPTRRTVPLGTVFRFRLLVPGRPAPFELEGVVVRNGTDGEEPGVGIRFRWADEERRRSFEGAVEAMMTASFGVDVARSLLDRGAGRDH